MPRDCRHSRFQQRCVFVIAVVLISVSLIGCRSKPAAQLLSANLSMAPYVQARSYSKARKESDFYFPSLEIYNDGILIYRGHEAVQNANVLRGMPASIRNMQPNPQSPSLADILEAIPEFKVHAQRILGRHQLAVVSVDLADCGECRVQTRAMDETTKRLLWQSIDILEIHIYAPP